MKYSKGFIALAIAVPSFVLLSCNLFTESCTMEVRMVPCVSINGSDTIDAKYTIYRSIGGKIDTADDMFSRRCFTERTGKVTLFVAIGDSVVAQKQVKIKEEKGNECHAVHTTVDFGIVE